MIWYKLNPSSSTHALTTHSLGLRGRREHILYTGQRTCLGIVGSIALKEAVSSSRRGASHGKRITKKSMEGRNSSRQQRQRDVKEEAGLERWVWTNLNMLGERVWTWPFCDDQAGGNSICLLDHTSPREENLEEGEKTLHNIQKTEREKMERISTRSCLTFYPWIPDLVNGLKWNILSPHNSGNLWGKVLETKGAVDVSII